MFATRFVAAAFAACLVAPCALAAGAADSAPHYLDRAAFRPDLLLPAPPQAGSARERAELAQVRAIEAAATSERLERARWDDAHENPEAFHDVLGRDLSTLPRTTALLGLIANETEYVLVPAKDQFARARPFAADPALRRCGKVDAKPTRSYPSGHAAVGYAMAWALAGLVPDRAPAIFARADDFAESRLVCGMHYPSDLEAAHVFGTLAAERLLADPRLAPAIAAARAELATH